jgi:hypothetical protein
MTDACVGTDAASPAMGSGGDPATGGGGAGARFCAVAGGKALVRILKTVINDTQRTARRITRSIAGSSLSTAAQPLVHHSALYSGVLRSYGI